MPRQHEEPINNILIGRNRRPLRDDKISALAQSIQRIGLLHPITVTQDGSRLVAGLHRLEACKSLGWSDIPVIRLTGSEMDAELAEIDENLIRNNLTVLEQALALARRKVIYEARFPETKPVRERGGPGRGHKKTDDTMSPVSFSTDAATKTGKSARTAQRQTRIGEALKDVAEDVAHTSIADNQKELLVLAKLAEDIVKTALQAKGWLIIPTTEAPETAPPPKTGKQPASDRFSELK